jgi:hypothetical protein
VTLSALIQSGSLVLALALFSCTQLTDESQENASDEPQQIPSTDPLSSWKETEQKQRILEFVEGVVNPDAPTYVPPYVRLAVFDGTIGCEKPTYMEVVVAMEQLCREANKDPVLYDDSLYIAACAKDYSYINNNVYKAILTAFDGYNQDAYVKAVSKTVRSSIDEHFGIPYNQMYYLPMLELINYLRENEFDVQIVSGSELGFLRAYGKDCLDILPQKVIGSAITLSYRYNQDLSKFVRDSSYMVPMSDGAGKPELIRNHIGIQPILAFGNTMGDYEMLTYASSNSYPNLELILVHDDSHEYIYFDKELDSIATANNWVVVRMKENFEVIFPR